MFISLVLLVLHELLELREKHLLIQHQFENNSRAAACPPQEEQQRSRHTAGNTVCGGAPAAWISSTGWDRRLWRPVPPLERETQENVQWDSLQTEYSLKIFLLWSDRISEFNLRTVSVWIIYLLIHQKDPTQNSDSFMGFLVNNFMVYFP